MSSTVFVSKDRAHTPQTNYYMGNYPIMKDVLSKYVTNYDATLKQTYVFRKPTLQPQLDVIIETATTSYR